MSPDRSLDAGEETINVVKRVLEAARAGNRSEAFEIANAALASGLRHPALFNVRAAWHGRRENYGEALADLEAARTFLPDDPALLDTISYCLMMLNRPREAIASCDSVIAMAPDFIQALHRKGLLHGMLNETDEMQRMYQRVVALKPDHADALGGLAILAAQSGDIAGARAYAERAIVRSPDQAVALVALAIADIADASLDSAAQKLKTVLEAPKRPDDWRLNTALRIAADGLAAHGHYSEAFQLRSALNARRRLLHAARFESHRAIDDVRRLNSYFEKRTSWGVTDPSPPSSDLPAARHVFLLGFVRSGTTLLEVVMASHPQVVATDEHDFLVDAAHAFLDSEGDLDRLATLGDHDLSQWREAYWRSVRDSGVRVGGRVFVDKVPLNSLRLPLIARLFPAAKIILALRDPRDVVLSSFFHRFDMNAASFEFLRLDDCARYYRSVMLLVERYREILHIDLCEHRYEDLIDDFERAAGRLCKFIGIDWTESMRDFTPAAGSIDRRSQSAKQVRHGLYAGAIGQWRHYRAQMETVLPDLQAVVDRLGYSSD